MSQVSDYTNYTNNLQQVRDSYDADKSDTRTQNEKQIQKVKDQAEETIQKARAEYTKRLGEERAQARDEIKKLKDELYDHNGKNATQETKDRKAEKETMNRFAEEVKAQADKKVASSEERSKAQIERDQEISDHKVTDALGAQRKSNYQEVKQLEEQLGEYQTANRDVASERAQARQQAIGENDHKYLAEKQQIIDGYERQMASLKDHQAEMSEHYSRELENANFKTNGRAQDQIRTQKEEFARVYQEGAKERANIEKSYQLQMDDLKNRHEKSSDQLIALNHANTDRVLANKDQTYQNYIATKDARFKADVNDRDEKIQKLQTTDDPLKVSPYVVKRIEDSAEQRNYQQLQAAQGAHDKDLEATRTRDLTERREMAEQHQAELVNVHHSARKELDLQNRQLATSFADMQNSKNSDVQNVSEQARSHAERTYQKHALELQDAQKNKQEALEDQREVLVYEKNSAVDDAEQARRLQDREWFLKANDVRRNYETKLSIEREDHEKILKDTRLEFDKKLRDQDRTSKIAIDDRVRSYEHLIAQQELAFKEKERFLTEHYEEELDKMKRTNANLIQKKS